MYSTCKPCEMFLAAIHWSKLDPAVFVARIAVVDGRVAGVGRFEWEASRTIRLDGRTVIPGLIDSHMHVESTLLTPAELSRLVVPRGTTAVISDSHEIGNVLGVTGIDDLAAAS